MVVDNPCNPDVRVLKEASAVAAAGNDVSIIAWDRGGALPRQELIGNVKVFRLQVRSGYQRRFGQIVPLFRFSVGAWALARRLRFDLLHCHDFPSLPMSGALTSFARRTLIYDAHEIYWLQEQSKYPRAFTNFLRLLELALLPRVRRLITVSDYLADYFRAHHPNVSVVGNWYNPVDLSTYDRASLRAQMGVPEAAFCLVSAGTLARVRLFPLLIDFARKNPDIYIVIAGRGEMERELAAASVAISNLRYLGWRSDPTTLYAVADASFYGLAAEDPYSRISSPNALFLSIAMRLPLIATNTGEAGALIERCEAGELLAATTVDALRGCVDRLHDPGRREMIRGRLAGLQDTYNWDRAAKHLLEAYAA